MAAAAFALGVVLPSCGRQPKMETPAPAVMETHWTDAAARKAAAVSAAVLKKHQPGFSLPQLRVYDAREQLVYQLHVPWGPATIGNDIDRAIAAGRPLAGPRLDETLADLQTVDDRPAGAVIDGRGKVTVVDYWATWCIPCKILEKALLSWAATKPAGSVQIVKAEADLMKFARAQGDKTYVMKKGPDGKLHPIEMK